jgi:FlaA1/EpsC-like NDP-sugar epimerase
MSLYDVLFDKANTVRRLYRFRRFVLLSVDIAATVIASTLATLLSFNLSLPAVCKPLLLSALCVWIPVKLTTFVALRIHRGSLRYVSVHDFIRLLIGETAAGGVSAGILIGWGNGLPKSIYVIQLLLCIVFTAGGRALIRLAGEVDLFKRNSTAKTRTIIYGAGAAGVALLKEISNNSSLAYQVCGFIDDQPLKTGSTICGVLVLGVGTALAALVKNHNIGMALIAIPSASARDMIRILENCHAAGIMSKTVPGLGEIIRNSCGLATGIRDVAVEDLLGRRSVRLEEKRICATFERKIVMVTGAAGSIGSELCRQVARFRPAGIVGFEIAESPLFETDREMRMSFPDIPFYPEIGSIQDPARLAEVMRQYSPSVVYHAAAYKHVPIMEAHVFEAIQNNILGTHNVAMAACDHGVHDFVMISSDKAVRPNSVMGATKRISELLLLALQNGRTKYVAVRFGNVLGSSGSVIPIFKKQIAAGGPVTVTHPEMRRFFMTVSEACQLVLQAAVVATGGQICVLDMGEPVKILDLARHLILLSGLRPDEDIKIEFSGVRPGEKLYEELSTLLDDSVPTGHENIRIYRGGAHSSIDALEWLDAVRDLCRTRDLGGLVLAMKKIVPDYSPSEHLLARLVERPRLESRHNPFPMMLPHHSNRSDGQDRIAAHSG